MNWKIQRPQVRAMIIGFGKTKCFWKHQGTRGNEACQTKLTGDCKGGKGAGGKLVTDGTTLLLMAWEVKFWSV